MPEGPSKDLIFKAEDERSSYQPGNNHLLLIGIDQYQQVARLSNAVRDARAVRDLFLQKYNFTSEHLHELYNGDAKKRQITKALRGKIETVQPGDNLLVYFSGHGHYDQAIEEGYWVPVDAEYNEIDDYITYSFLTKVIKAIPAQHTVFIVDSCYSGAALVRDMGLTADRFERDPSRWLLASGRNEVVPDGIAGGHSPFAEQLLSLLGRYSNQGLRMGTLVDKLTTAVTYNSRQTPIGRPLFGVGDEGGEFVFRPKRNQTADYQHKTERGSAQKDQIHVANEIQPKKAETPPTSDIIPLPNMIHIPGGTFQMGSNGKKDEKPVHSVTVSSFYMAETTVTFEQYDYFCEQIGYEKPHDEDWGRDNRPVINVSWKDAETYLKWLNQQPGQSGWRLPTEAEWEYAAGGGASDRTKYAGTNRAGFFRGLRKYAVHSRFARFGFETKPVKSKMPNGLGLYDMTGNVWEWCSDWYSNDYYGYSPRQDPAGPISGSRRVIRGGSLPLLPSRHLRIALRFATFPNAKCFSLFRSFDNRSTVIGFRLARTP